MQSRSTVSKLIVVDVLDLAQIIVLVLAVELGYDFILLAHLGRHMGQQVVDEMLQRFLWSIYYQLFVAGSQCFRELGVLLLVHAPPLFL